MSTTTPTETDWLAAFKAACANLPEHVELPYNLTPEGERLARFRRICPPEFMQRINPALLTDSLAFNRVLDWDGSFPGPCAIGATATAKTRAAWSSLGRLYVRHNRAFAWFPVKRLVTELAKYEENSVADEFFRQYDFYPVLMVDDLDKLNWQFESQVQALFSFYDWAYRSKKPVITTTNKDRTWWRNKMGDAFTRRLFDDAHFAVEFGKPQSGGLPPSNVLSKTQC